MIYFILYNISDPHSLNFGLNIEERPTFEAAQQFIWDLRAYDIEPVKLIQGNELGIEEFERPFIKVLLDE